MNLLGISLLIINLVPIYLITMFIPYITRKTESFGVSIPSNIYYNPLLVIMRKRYVMLTGLLSIFSTAIFILLTITTNQTERTISLIFTAILIIYLVSSFFIYLSFHRNMKNLKKAENWAANKSQQVLIDTTFRNKRLTYSNWLFVIPFSLSIMTLGFTLYNYDSLPSKIPLNYSFSGEITNWTTKSYRSVLIIPVMQMYLTGIFLFVNLIIAKAKQQVSIENPEQSSKQNITFRRRWSLFTIVNGFALVLMFTIMQLSLVFPIHQFVILSMISLITGGSIIGAIVLSFNTGQGGSKLGKVTTEAGNVIDRDDDEYWKLGQFYFNKEDPSLFIEKRFGVGWTNNWARPLSWIILLLIILLAVGIPILLSN